jgi:hypothetical protein
VSISLEVILLLKGYGVNERSRPVFVTYRKGLTTASPLDTHMLNKFFTNVHYYEEAGISPERLAACCGVSGMTLRFTTEPAERAINHD